MRGVNKVIIVGTLGRDPETRYFPDGGAVTQLSVATSDYWTDKETGERQESTEWHRIVIFGRLAEVAGEYLKKGSKAYFEGQLTTRKFQDKQTGQDRYVTEIKAHTLQMLDARPQDGGSPPQRASQYDEPMPGFDDRGQGQQRAPQQRQGQQRRQQQVARAPSNTEQADLSRFDDDIPF